MGQLALQGVDPRRWDLNQLVSAYEVTLQQGSKDEAAWRRTRMQLYAEPGDVKQARTERRKSSAAPDPQPTGRHVMTLDGVEAMLATAAARDARFGSG